MPRLELRVHRRRQPPPAAFLLLMATAGAVAPGCSAQRDSPFVVEPSPDLAVTTLQQRDLERVARMLQLEQVLTEGGHLAATRPLPADVAELMEDVQAQQRVRADALDAMVVTKNAPRPQRLDQAHHRRLDALAQAGDRRAGVLTFQRQVQTEAMRVWRDAADRADDPDVRELATRHLGSFVGTLQRLDRLDGTTSAR